MADFPKALRPVLEFEGVRFDDAGTPIPGKTGYANHPSDNGKETNWGITKGTALMNGYVGEMKDLPYERATVIYKAKYWDRMRGDVQPDQEIAGKMFDVGVNMGMRIVIEFLQDTLNVLNKGGTLWPDRTVDGAMGDGTMAGLASALGQGPRFQEAIMRALTALQRVRYVQISKGNPKQEDFTLGWLLRGEA